MKNNFCRLPQEQIQKLNVPYVGLLLSPFHLNVRGGFVLVPEDAFQEMTDVITNAAIVGIMVKPECKPECSETAVSGTPTQVVGEVVPEAGIEPATKGLLVLSAPNRYEPIPLLSAILLSKSQHPHFSTHEHFDKT